MVYLSFRVSAVVAIVLASGGCSANTATQERPQERQRQATAPDNDNRIKSPSPTGIPESPTDRLIRRDLNLSISHDADLKHRDISFIVTNGDISVTGIVRTEDERRKINDLAMNIDGVKSVANAVLIAE